MRKKIILPFDDNPIPVMYQTQGDGSKPLKKSLNH